MQLFLAFFLLLSAAHAATSTNLTESEKHRRAAVNYLTVNTVIPASGLFINLQSFDTNQVVKVTSNQKLAMTNNMTRMATFKLTKLRGTKWALQEYNSGLYVSAEEAGKKSLRATRSQARSWELFNAVSVGSANNVFTLASEINGKLITVNLQKTITAKTSRTDTLTGLLVNFQLVIVTPPQVLDSSAIALVGTVGGNNPSNLDDHIYSVTMPFPVTLYGQTSSNLAVSSNGYITLITLTANRGDSTYSPQRLPTTVLSFTQATLFPLWQDLYFNLNTSQGLFFQVSGTAPNRVFNIEYYASQYSEPTQYYHFLVTFYENRPGVFRYTYYTISDSGLRGSVGAQCSACTNSPFTQFSFKQQGMITDGLVIEYNPNTNTFVPVSP